MFTDIAKRCRLIKSLLPDFFLDRAEYDIVVADILRSMFREHRYQDAFKFILMRDNQLAFGAVPACLPQDEWTKLVYVNQEWKFSEVGQALAFWTTTKPYIMVRI